MPSKQVRVYVVLYDDPTRLDGMTDSIFRTTSMREAVAFAASHTHCGHRATPWPHLVSIALARRWALA